MQNETVILKEISTSKYAICLVHTPSGLYHVIYGTIQDPKLHVTQPIKDYGTASRIFELKTEMYTKKGH